MPSTTPRPSHRFVVLIVAALVGALLIFAAPRASFAQDHAFSAGAGTLTIAAGGSDTPDPSSPDQGGTPASTAPGPGGSDASNENSDPPQSPGGTGLPAPLLLLAIIPGLGMAALILLLLTHRDPPPPRDRGPSA